MIRTLSIRPIRFSSLLGAALLTLTGPSAMAATQATAPGHLIHHGKANKAALVAKAEPSATSAPGAAATTPAAAATPADPASVKAAAKGDHKARKTAAKSTSHMKEKAAVVAVAPEGSANPAAPAPAAERGSPKGTEKAGVESTEKK